jgi:hypothetical protein
MISAIGVGASGKSAFPWTRDREISVENPDEI